MEQIHQYILTGFLMVFIIWMGYTVLRNIRKTPDQLKNINQKAKDISHRLDIDMTHYINHIKRTKNKKKK